MTAESGVYCLVMVMNDNELKLLIAARMDVTEFLDIIGYDLADLLEKLGEEIEEFREELVAACS